MHQIFSCRVTSTILFFFFFTIPGLCEVQNVFVAGYLSLFFFLSELGNSTITLQNQDLLSSESGPFTPESTVAFDAYNVLMTNLRCMNRNCVT